MRLTTYTVAAASTALVIGLVLLLESSPTSAFRLSDEGKGDQKQQEKSSINSNNKIINEINSRDKGHVVVPYQQSSLSSSSTSSDSSSATSSRSSSNVVAISKRSLSSSSSSSSLSSDPSSFRSHRHENSILNVAWPPGGMWGFLPSNKKIAAAPPPLPSSSLHSQSSSATSSFNKKASSLLSSSASSDSSSPSLHSKKKSSDLFLDPVTLDESPSFFSSRHRPISSNGVAAPNSFFHSSASSSLSSPSGSSSSGGTSSSGGGGADAKMHPTPPPRPHYILGEPPTRIEAPLEDDVGARSGAGQPEQENDDLLENEILEEEGEHSSWLKRSSNSGIVSRSSADYNKRKRDYDVPQIGKQTLF